MCPRKKTCEQYATLQGRQGSVAPGINAASKTKRSMEQFTLETSYLKAHSMQKLSMTSLNGG